jgi:hypothetical protein
MVSHWVEPEQSLRRENWTRWWRGGAVGYVNGTAINYMNNLYTNEWIDWLINILDWKWWCCWVTQRRFQVLTDFLMWCVCVCVRALVGCRQTTRQTFQAPASEDGYNGGNATMRSLYNTTKTRAEILTKLACIHRQCSSSWKGPLRKKRVQRNLKSGHDMESLC